MWGISATYNDGYPCLQWTSSECPGPNKRTITDPTPDKKVAIVVDENCNLTKASAAAATDNAVKDPAYKYDRGFVQFEADCGEAGFTTEVELILYGADIDHVVRKYNPTNNAYFTIDSATKTAVTVGGQSAVRVVYAIKDGGELDIDGEENGIIRDPVSLGYRVLEAPKTGVSSFKQPWLL